MNNSQIVQTVHETGKLPDIIADVKVFGEMTRAERTNFYGSINNAIKKVVGTKDFERFKRSQDLYKRMCLYPQKRLNEAFLENKFSNETLWHFYVNILEYCLYEHLQGSLTSFQENHKALTIEMKRAEMRIQAMKEDIEKYTPNFESNE